MPEWEAGLREFLQFLNYETLKTYKISIIFCGRAHQEHGLLEPMLEGVREAFNGEHFNEGDALLKKAKVSADNGFHNSRTLEHLETQQIDAYIADGGFRSRDPRFQSASRHKAKMPPKPKKVRKKFAVADVQINLDKKTCICTAGKSLWLKCARARIQNNIFMQFQGRQADCDACELRGQCLRDSKQKGARQVCYLLESLPKFGIQKDGPIERMKRKIDSTLGRHIYSQRLGIVEPAFGNIRETLGLRRFSLRGRTKVNSQWQLMTMVHNIFKIHRYGWVL